MPATPAAVETGYSVKEEWERFYVRVCVLTVARRGEGTLDFDEDSHSAGLRCELLGTSLACGGKLFLFVYLSSVSRLICSSVCISKVLFIHHQHSSNYVSYSIRLLVGQDLFIYLIHINQFISSSIYLLYLMSINHSF